NNRLTYPILHRMAFDFLSISSSGYSIHKTCLFTRQQLLHFTHNRLSPSTIHAFLYLGAWRRCGLLFIEDLL
ncbi:hypothetical protein J3A83DRAFT_4069007, partial [Scleroderma citrinum]